MIVHNITSSVSLFLLQACCIFMRICLCIGSKYRENPKRTTPSFPGSTRRSHQVGVIVLTAWTQVALTAGNTCLAGQSSSLGVWAPL